MNSLIFLCFSALIIIKNVYQTKTLAASLHGNAFGEDNWSCETVNAVPCPEGMMEIHPSDWKIPTLRAYINTTFMDRNKTLSTNWYSYNAVMYNDRNVVEFFSANPSTPCLTNFSVCIQDPFVPPIRLDCRYLKDFERTEDDDSKCGINGAKQETYTMDSGFNITKFDFNCEKVRIEKPVPQTEPTEPTV